MRGIRGPVSGFPGQGQVQAATINHCKQFGIARDPYLKTYHRVNLCEASKNFAEKVFSKVFLKPETYVPGHLGFMQGAENAVVQLKQPASMAEQGFAYRC